MKKVARYLLIHITEHQHLKISIMIAMRLLNAVRQRFYLSSIFFALFSISVLSAQDQFIPGSVTLKNGDEITGFIENGNPKSNAKYLLFRKTLESPVTRYTASDVENYQFEGFKYYVSRQVVVDDIPKEVFFEYLVDGVVELFYYADPFKDRFYIEKDGELHELQDDSYITQSDLGTVRRKTYGYTGYLKYIMKDAPTLFGEIENAKFEHGDFIEITKAYHDLTCTDGTECIVYERKAGKLKDAKWKIRPVGFVGGGTSKLQITSVMKSYISREAITSAPFPNFVSSEEFGGIYFDGMNNVTKVNTTFVTPTFGLNFSNKWSTSIQVEANYKSLSFEYKGADIEVGYTQGSLLGIKEFAYYSKIRPYILTGAAFNFFHNYDFRNILVENPRGDETALIDVDVLNEVGNSTAFRNRKVNPLVNWTWGLGGLYEMPGGQKLKAEIRYDFHLSKLWGGVNTDAQVVISDISTLHFQVGFML